MIAWRLGPSGKPTVIPGHPIYVAVPEHPETVDFSGSTWQVAHKISGWGFGVNDAGIRVDRFDFANGTPNLEVPKGSQVVWLTFL